MPNPILGPGGFHHVCVKTRDWDRTMEFYRAVLGCTDKIAWRSAPERAAMLDTGDGNYIEIFAGGTKEPKLEGCWFHIAIRTDNCDAALARARAAGMEVTFETKDLLIPSMPEPTPIRIAFFKGPDGESIELFQNEKT